MSPYLIFASLEDFIREALRAKVERVHTEMMSSTSWLGGIPSSEEYTYTMTALADGMVMATRIPLYGFSRVHPDGVVREIREKLRQHQATISAILDAHVGDHGVHTAAGFLLVPGLRDDLLKIQAGQELWKFKLAKKDDPTSVELVINTDWAPLSLLGI